MRKQLSVFSIILTLIVFVLASSVFAANEVVSGPFSLTVNSGVRNDSAYAGFEGRLDYLTPVINVHAVGLYEALDAHQGQGDIDTQRYGGAVALSHTYGKKANVYIGFSLLNEFGHNFTQAYMGGKLKLTDNFLVNAGFGVGFGPEHFIDHDDDGLGYFVKASDWVRVGGIYVFDNGLKTNLYAYLNSLGDHNIFGLDESFPIRSRRH